MVINKVPNLDANHLVIFYVVATENSLTSAADKLHLSQPAITYHIKCLEESVRLKLIGFKKQKVILTPAGERILQYAGEIYRQLVNTERESEFIKHSCLRVGIGSIYIPLIAPVLRTIFEKQHPVIRLTVKSGNAFDMVEDILNFKLDLIIIQNIDYGNKNLKHIPVSNPERLICFASPTHPLCHKELVDWKDLTDYPIVIGPESTAMHRMVFSKFKSSGLSKIPELAAEVHSTEWGKRLVENGTGISFSLIKDVEKEICEGRLKILPLKEDIWVTADIILRSDTYMHPIINNFITLVRQAFNYNPELSRQSSS